MWELRVGAERGAKQTNKGQDEGEVDKVKNNFDLRIWR